MLVLNLDFHIITSNAFRTGTVKLHVIPSLLVDSTHNVTLWYTLSVCPSVHLPACLQCSSFFLCTWVCPQHEILSRQQV